MEVYLMIMKNEDKYLNEVMQGFQDAKGKACLFCPNTIDYINIVVEAIRRYRVRRPDEQILIIIGEYSTRMKLCNKLSIEGLLNNVKILTYEYVKTIYAINFIILLDLDDIPTFDQVADNTKFVFGIYSKMYSADFINHVRNKLVNIEANISVNQIMSDRVNSPIEEHRIGVNMSDKDLAQYTKCDNYIKDCMSIFGSLEIANYCRIGNVNTGISAAQYRQELAYANGWSPTLDMSVPIYKNIDDVYNPNTLYERASILYNIIRERSNIVSDNTAKLEKIYNIIKDNPNKKILIISKRGEFANKIADYITNAGIECGCYHNDIESQYLNDENGNIICYKSGANKGKYKLFGAQAISNACMAAYNEDRLNILSAKASSSDALSILVDILIITFPIAGDYEEIVNRFIHSKFVNGLQLYKIYCNNSTESKEIEKQVPKRNVKLVENCLNIVIEEQNDEI